MPTTLRRMREAAFVMAGDRRRAIKAHLDCAA